MNKCLSGLIFQLLLSRLGRPKILFKMLFNCLNELQNNRLVASQRPTFSCCLSFCYYCLLQHCRALLWWWRRLPRQTGQATIQQVFWLASTRTATLLSATHMEKASWFYFRIDFERKFTCSLWQTNLFYVYKNDQSAYHFIQMTSTAPCLQLGSLCGCPC